MPMAMAGPMFVCGVCGSANMCLKKGDAAERRDLWTRNSVACGAAERSMMSASSKLKCLAVMGGETEAGVVAI